MEKEKFGLFTCVSMIAGIVIGSGIFFKTDDILVATSGSVLYGVLLWIVGAIGIIFGGLCVSEYAKRSDHAGGLITYCEMAWGNLWGYVVGWFQIIFYFPAITAILAWISAIYIGLLVGIKDALDVRIWVITVLILMVFFILNITKTLWASKFQNMSLVIKIGALVILSLIGIFFGDVSHVGVEWQQVEPRNLFAGLVACAFAYDGWFVAPSIAHELKNPKRNLPLALILAPTLILIVYLLYFVGINLILGPTLIMQLGDGSVGYIVNQVMGPIGIKVVYVTVIVSVLGAVNGVILGYIRMPYALAIRDAFPNSHAFKKLNPRFDISIPSAVLCFGLICIWLGLHSLSQFNIAWGNFQLSGLEIDSLPIVLTYFFYMSLYIKLIFTYIESKQYQKLFLPLMAIFGALLVLYGGMSQDNAWIYFMISFIGIGAGILIRPKKEATYS